MDMDIPDNFCLFMDLRSKREQKIQLTVSKSLAHLSFGARTVLNNAGWVRFYFDEKNKQMLIVPSDGDSLNEFPLYRCRTFRARTVIEKILEIAGETPENYFAFVFEGIPGGGGKVLFDLSWYRKTERQSRRKYIGVYSGEAEEDS